jgi:hypothetical protein
MFCTLRFTLPFNLYGTMNRINLNTAMWLWEMSHENYLVFPCSLGDPFVDEGLIELDLEIYFCLSCTASFCCPIYKLHVVS